MLILREVSEEEYEKRCNEIIAKRHELIRQGIERGYDVAPFLKDGEKVEDFITERV